MSITRFIEIVPALRRVELLHVGCWEQLNLEFVPGLNIITGESALGKTTILRAILQAFFSSTRIEHPLSVTSGFVDGRIIVEFMSQTVSVRLGALDGVQSGPENYESLGQFMLRLLRSHLEAAIPGSAVLVEDEVTAALDISQFVTAVKLLNDSHCQVICLSTHRLNLKDFPEASVYVCSLDQLNKPRMRLQQPGGGDQVNSTPHS